MLSLMSSYPSSMDPALTDSPPPQPEVPLLCSALSARGPLLHAPCALLLTPEGLSSVRRPWLKARSFVRHWGQNSFLCSDSVIHNRKGEVRRDGYLISRDGSKEARSTSRGTAAAWSAGRRAPTAVARRRTGTRKRGWRAAVRWDFFWFHMWAMGLRGQGSKKGTWLPEGMIAGVTRMTGLARGEFDGRRATRCHMRGFWCSLWTE